MLYLGRFLITAIFLLLSTVSWANESFKDQELKEIELKISSAAERKHQYSVDLENLDHKYHKLQHELIELQKKIDSLKINIKKTIQSEFILRNKSILKMLLESNTQNNLSNILFYKKINFYQAKKISEYLNLIHQRKYLTQELSKNLTSLNSLQTATHHEIHNLKTAYTERSKILHNTQATNLGEIKIKAKPKSQNLASDNSPTSPLEKITSQQIYYVQKNRALIYASEGSRVLAINHGEVVFCGWMRGYGIIIIIDHGENLMSLYGHNQTTFKKSGDKVHKGEVISLVGKSGGHEKPGLYFEVRKNGISINLNKWLKITGQNND
jgi:septal ring factor EnvC (AmiA/AmiB activator)